MIRDLKVTGSVKRWSKNAAGFDSKFFFDWEQRTNYEIQPKWIYVEERGTAVRAVCPKIYQTSPSLMKKCVCTRRTAVSPLPSRLAGLPAAARVRCAVRLSELHATRDGKNRT